MGMTGRALALAFAAALAALASGREASAHAAYAASEPAFGAVLERAPERISLTFSQELFRRAGANVIEWAAGDGGEAGEFSSAGEAEIGNEDRRTMSATLSAEARAGWGAGRFVVRWRNLSADDGDADAGEFPFYVGREPTGAEEALDRAMAAELLISYPGDEVEGGAEVPEVAAAAPVAVAREEEPAGGLSVGAAIWLAAGLAAAAALIMVPAVRRRARLRGGG